MSPAFCEPCPWWPWQTRVAPSSGPRPPPSGEQGKGARASVSSQEIRELQREQSKEFAAEALESNLFEWIFAIRGPLGSPFEGGIYVGRIMLPHNYPMAPPSFMFMTANGWAATSHRHPRYAQGHGQ